MDASDDESAVWETLHSTYSSMVDTLGQAKDRLDQHRKALSQEKAQLAKEVQAMKKFPIESDVIELNVGGVPLATYKSTLTKYPHSMLGAMFSGRYPYVKDSQGRFFLDRDPEPFKIILSWLRSGVVYWPEDKTLLAQVLQEADFFNLLGPMTHLPSSQRVCIFSAVSCASSGSFWTWSDQHASSSTLAMMARSLGANRGAGSLLVPGQDGRLRSATAGWYQVHVRATAQGSTNVYTTLLKYDVEEKQHQVAICYSSSNGDGTQSQVLSEVIQLQVGESIAVQQYYNSSAKPGALHSSLCAEMLPVTTPLCVFSVSQSTASGRAWKWLPVSMTDAMLQLEQDAEVLCILSAGWYRVAARVSIGHTTAESSLHINDNKRITHYKSCQSSRNHTMLLADVMYLHANDKLKVVSTYSTAHQGVPYGQLSLLKVCGADPSPPSSATPVSAALEEKKNSAAPSSATHRKTKSSQRKPHRLKPIDDTAGAVELTLFRSETATLSTSGQPVRWSNATRRGLFNDSKSVLKSRLAKRLQGDKDDDDSDGDKTVTIPVSGHYLLNARTCFTASAQAHCSLYINGTEAKRYAVISQSAHRHTCAFSEIISLHQGDKLSLKPQFNGSFHADAGDNAFALLLLE